MRIADTPTSKDTPPSLTRVLARLLTYVGRYKGRILLASLCSVLGVAVELLRPWPVQIVVDYVLNEDTKPAWLTSLSTWLPGAESRQGLLVWSVGTAVGITVAGAALSLVTLNLTVAVAQRLVFDLSMDLFSKLQRLSLAYHRRNPLGDLLQRASQDVFVVYFLVANVALPGAVSLLALGGMFLIMAQLDLGLALLALAIVPLLAATLGIFARPMDTTTNHQYATQGAVMSLLEQSLSNVKVIQGFARETYVQQKMEERARTMGDAYGAAVRVSGAYGLLTAALTGVAAAVLLGVGGSRVISGQLTIGELLVFLGYLAAFYGPVTQLTSAVGYAVQVAARGRRVLEVLEAEEEVRERPGARDLGRARGEVVFDEVSFGYAAESKDEARPLLFDISLSASRGQITAIIGATGAGKTSLLGLLTRFYDPLRGRVLIDGHDIRDVTLQSLRENVALVLQEPFLFPMSVAENIGFGRPGASRDEIIAAARAAHADEFIRRLPEGYDSLIGEKGASLSGGERQRISIARALLKDAPILILDEPTSALDAATEAKIFEAISHLMRDRTTFIISHRLSTIRRADQILALDEGRIVERGTHEFLLAKGDLYADLYRRQDPAATVQG
ncbi:MAG: ABC transporter ATP-binding protein/permease [Chloroflexota bacterium]|nr:ABC transporter ATP-binding protein/permease [Chloroflexota bacterium]